MSPSGPLSALCSLKYMCVHSAMQDGQKQAREDMSSALPAKLFTLPGQNFATPDCQNALHNMAPQFAAPVDTSTANTLGQNRLSHLLIGSELGGVLPFTGLASGPVLVLGTSNLNLPSAQTPIQLISGAANTSFGLLSASTAFCHYPQVLAAAQSLTCSGPTPTSLPPDVLSRLIETQQNAPNIGLLHNPMTFPPSDSTLRGMIHGQKATKCETGRRKPPASIARQSVRPQDLFFCCVYAVWRILLSVCMPTHEE